MNYYVHKIDPIIFSLGPLTVRWYGLMYLVGFFLAYLYLKRQYRVGRWALPPLKTQDLFTYLLTGMLVGARMIYVLVYNREILDEGWWKVFAVWEGGLSYHGAALGFTVAMLAFAKREKIHFFHLADHVCTGAALGVLFGRIGNFINGELYGRATDVPWAVIFPDGGLRPRHPSQIYQGLCEGLLIFIILLVFQKWEVKKGNAPSATDPNPKKWKRTGLMASIYFALYGVARFCIEFFRQPDPQLGFYFGWMTMGQILCTIMILVGTIVLIYRIKKPLPIEYSNNQ